MTENATPEIARPRIMFRLSMMHSCSKVVEYERTLVPEGWQLIAMAFACVEALKAPNIVLHADPKGAVGT
ncbi:hypothetical protein ACVDG5_025780 [Mesorhizobium sp. ORM6]